MAENRNALLDATTELVKLRMERDDLNARIAALESDMNHLVGAEQLTKKLYSNLAEVCLAK